MDLNNEKLLLKVNEYIIQTTEALKKNKSIFDIHRDVLNICEIVYKRRKDYGIIDVEYPIEMNAIITNYENDTIETIKWPDNEHIREFEKSLGLQIIQVLDNIKRFIELKESLKISMDKPIKKDINSIKQDIMTIKKELIKLNKVIKKK